MPHFDRWFLTLIVGVCLITPAGCEKKKESSGGSSNDSNNDDKGDGSGGGANRKPRAFGDQQMAALRMQDQNNLKLIGLAMHTYQDVNRWLPTAATFDEKSGRPLLSWRVAILPYIEEDALYKEFRLDEPWDSEHNKALIPRMPKIYLLPGSGSEREGYTNYRVFAGIPSVCQQSTPMFDWPEPKFQRKPAQIGFQHVTDGLSNTIMVAEAAEAVIWTKPDELMVDPKKPLPRLGYFWNGASNILIGDGSVRAISDKLSEKTLRLAIGRYDGQVMGADW